MNRLRGFVQTCAERYHARDFARIADDWRNRLVIDAVLRGHDDARRLQKAHRVVRRPNGVVRLDGEKYRVERLCYLVRVSEMHGVDPGGELAVLR